MSDLTRRFTRYPAAIVAGFAGLYITVGAGLNALGEGVCKDLVQNRWPIARTNDLEFMTAWWQCNNTPLYFGVAAVVGFAVSSFFADRGGKPMVGAFAGVFVGMISASVAAHLYTAWIWR